MIFTFRDLESGCLAVERVASVGIDHFDACGTEISLLLCAEFLGLCVQRESPFIPGLIRVAGEPPVILHNLIGHICIADRRSIVEMKKVIQIADLHLIRRMSRV